MPSDSSDPGPYRAAKAEYQRGILDACTDPETQEVVMMASAQVGKTLILTFVIGFHVEQDPANILLVMPTLDAAKDYSKEKLAPFLNETPSLAKRTVSARVRDSDTTLLKKRFLGGAHLAMAGANSPTSLASRHRRILICDEVDKYEESAGSEGDPINLAKKRTRTYWNRKHLYASTPNLSKHSRIEDLYESSDKRRFYVPCAHCGQKQVLVWSQVKYVEGAPYVDKHGETRKRAERAWYECEFCRAEWSESDRLRAVQRGEWRATAPFHGRAGFHIWAGYSPYVTLTELASEWLEAQGKPEQLKDFVNGTLGETWAERGEAPDWKRLFDRAEEYKIGTVPRGGLFLTAGVDVQDDRLEVQVIAWGRRKQSWLVDYIVLHGDVTRSEVWEQLTSVLGTVYQHENGEDMVIRKMAVDSGHKAPVVYTWARQHRSGGVVAVVKGGPDSMTAIVGTPSAAEITTNGKRLDTGVKVYLVNVSHLKGQFYGWLRHELPTVEGRDLTTEDYPDGFFHLCGVANTEEYCRQLTAEQLITRHVKGFARQSWEKSRRNEALDTWIYAYAAAIMMGVDRFQESHWSQLERQLGLVKRETPVLPAEHEPQVAPIVASRAVANVRRRVIVPPNW